MANRLKVEELRNELTKRDLVISGTKPTLVRRLESAIRKENKQLSDGNVNSVTKKRARDTEEEIENDGNSRIKAIDELRDLNIQQLRKQATLCGVSAAGSKKELLERLRNSSGERPSEFHEASEQGSNKVETVVTATKKGGAVLDLWLPDDIKDNYHVLQVRDGIHDAVLNQTNVGDNNNKFYVIQALESDDGSCFIVFNRWGRVGVKGQHHTHGPYTSCEVAIANFESKFYEKTKNCWENRKEFISYPKSYTWLDMDYGEKEKETNSVNHKPQLFWRKVNGNSELAVGAQLRQTQLEMRVAKFISVICNISMMKQQMMEIGYNADKLPLGKLSKSTISKGYDVLKRIADVIGYSNRRTLEQLSGEFYTLIPHDFGFKKMRDFVIDSPQKLKHKLEMVEALSEIEVATKLLKADTEMQGDPLYSHYQRLHCGLFPLDFDSDEFAMISKYTQNTHASTHSNYAVDIVHIFRVSREGESDRFRKFSSTKNKMLLWHGSRLTNWIGILSQGLRIAPPEAPATGYMFGKGVYFADMFSKSANYCYASNTLTTGVLLLCEVALGDMNELLTANYDADKLPEGKLSTKGVGGTAPDLSEAQVLDDGVLVPLGKPNAHSRFKGALLYNEYIVYNVDQIKMRYIVQVNFNFKGAA